MTAADIQPETVNHCPITDGDAALRHIDYMLHDLNTKLDVVLEFATPEVRAMIGKWLSNPITRWGTRNGRT
jgi:hypothetical protein